MPSQWETALLCKDVSHWLGTNLESALIPCSQNTWQWGLLMTVTILLLWFEWLICWSCFLEVGGSRWSIRNRPWDHIRTDGPQQRLRQGGCLGLLPGQPLLYQWSARMHHVQARYEQSQGLHQQCKLWCHGNSITWPRKVSTVTSLM